MDRQLPTLEWVNNREIRVWARVHTTSFGPHQPCAPVILFLLPDNTAHRSTNVGEAEPGASKMEIDITS